MSKESHIYVMAQKLDDMGFCSPCKVGITDNPSSRLSAIRTSSPINVEMFFSVRVPSKNIALRFEKMFHQTQRGKLIRGEWFNLDPIICAQIIQLHLALAMHSDSMLADDARRAVDEMSTWHSGAPQ